MVRAVWGVLAALSIGAVATLAAGSVVDLAHAQARPTITTEDLARLRDLHGLTVSPDGRQVAFQIVQADPSRNRFNSAWYTTSLNPGQKPTRLGDAGSMSPVGEQGQSGLIALYRPAVPPVWSPDSRWIAFLRWDGRRSQLWRVRPGAKAEQLTRGEGHVRAAVFTPDGSRILYETEPSLAQLNSALSEEGRNGFLFDRRFLPLYGQAPVYPADMQYADNTLFAQSAIVTSARRIWTYDLSKRVARLATTQEQQEFNSLTRPPQPRGGRAYFSRSAASPGGGSAWSEARNPALQGADPPLTVVAQPVGSSSPIVCAAADCTDRFIRGIWWRNDDELIFERQDGSQGQDSSLYAWRVRTGAVRLILRTPARFNALTDTSGSSCAVAQGQLICFLEEPTRPRRLVRIDLDTGAIITILEPNLGFERFDIGPVPQRLDFRTASGVETYGYLMLPPRREQGQRLPLVVVTYRCSGFMRGSVGDEYPIYPLAAQGFAVLCLSAPENRDQEAKLDPEALERWGRGPGAPERRRNIEALQAAISTLDEMKVIDPDRVGVTGLSFGAEVVGFALIDLPAVSAGISSSAPGVGGAMDYFLTTQTVRDVWRRVWQLGSPDETPERWREFAFGPNVDRVRAPLLINAADHEMLEAVEPVVRLQDAGRAVEMHVYPDEYHQKWQPAHRLAIYNRNIDWMNFWLRGVESDLSKSPAQYVRWRAMRESQCKLFGPNGAERKADEAPPWYCRPGAPVDGRSAKSSLPTPTPARR